jgi:putative endonuclease
MALTIPARTDLEIRLAQHQTGHFGGYNATRRPVVLVYSEYFEHIVDAIAAERQIKGWSRAKKEALIAGRFDLLPALSRRRS